MIFQHSVKAYFAAVGSQLCLYVYCAIFVCEVCCAHALIVHMYNVYNDFGKVCLSTRFQHEMLWVMGHI